MPQEEARQAPGYVVLRQVGDDLWQLVGGADRQPGNTARNARAQAVLDATKGEASPDEVYAVVLRSEWRIALDHCGAGREARSPGRGIRCHDRGLPNPLWGRRRPSLSLP